MKPSDSTDTPPIEPRFIPTLTEVIELEEQAPELTVQRENTDPVQRIDSVANVDESMPAASSLPPATEAAHTENTPPPDAQTILSNNIGLIAPFSDELTHQIMQKVDYVLAQRIKEAVALIIEQQTRTLLPQLREELESTVRKTLDEATADVLTQVLEAKNSNSI